MLRPIRRVFLSLTLVSGLAFAGGDDRKDAASLREAEVRFADGSTVKVLLLQEDIEVETKYGKLKVPTHEIRRIEFGVHLSEELAKKVADAIRRLSSDTFKDRETAGKDLLHLGAGAFPALKVAAKSPDLEISQRAQTVIEQLRKKLPAAELRAKEQDLILTHEFPVHGRILSPIFKVRTAYFGDLDLKITELRAMRWTAGSNEPVELAVDAGTYGGAAENQWLKTEVEGDAEAKLVIEASGQIDLFGQERPGQIFSGPEGCKQAGQRNGTYLPGTLLGRIGEQGEIFVIGKHAEHTINKAGKLYLRIVPLPGSEGSTGNYKVKIEGGRKVAD